MDNTDPIIFRLDEAKRERWADVRRHQEWFTKAAEFWGKDYAKTGSAFSQDMMQRMHEALSQISDFQDLLELPTTYCAPRLFPFPDYPYR